MAMTKKTYYGSGRVYSADYDASTFPKVADTKAITPEEAAAVIKYISGIMVEDNQIGYLKDGYEVKVETSNLSDKSDLGEMKLDAISDEKGTSNFKLFNANGETIAKQYPTAKYSKDTASGFGFTFVGALATWMRLFTLLHSSTMTRSTAIPWSLLSARTQAALTLYGSRTA